MNFIGREEQLKKLTEYFQIELGSEAMTRLVCVLYGLGGMGKTQVAAEFVHQHKNSFDAIICPQSALRIPWRNPGCVSTEVKLLQKKSGYPQIMSAGVA